MIDQEWKAAEAQRLIFDDDQMDMLLRIATRAYLVASKTTYDELAAHMLARTDIGRAEELKRMSVILGDDGPVPLTMRHAQCGRQGWWHVRYANRSDGFFCTIHLPVGPLGIAAVKYGGVEPCQGECVIIEEIEWWMAYHW